MNEAGKAAAAIRAALAEVNALIDDNQPCDCDNVRKSLVEAKGYVVALADKALLVETVPSLILAADEVLEGTIEPSRGLPTLPGPIFRHGMKLYPIDYEYKLLVAWAEKHMPRLREISAKLEAMALVATEPSDQASIPHAMAAALYAKNRTGLTEGDGYARKRVSSKLKSPQHRVGKSYLRQSVLNLAAADEAAAAERSDRKLEKQRGKNEKTVTPKF